MSSGLGDRCFDQMASQPDASLCLGSPLYISPSSTTLVLHLGIEKYRLLQRRASESAIDMLSCLHCATTARHIVCIIIRRRDLILSGSPIQETVSQNSSVSPKRWVHAAQGFKLASSRLGGRCSDQTASQLDASLILGSLLYIAPSSPPVPSWYSIWVQRHIVCRSGRQVNLPVTCQAACIGQPQPDVYCATYQA